MIRAESYEESLEREVRRAKGIYYTPSQIVSDMLSTLTIEGDEIFCDPCCGGGNFLMGALERGLRAENIYGYDSDPQAVEIARARVLEATGYDASENIRVADFFEVSPSLEGRFDIVASNPPWGSYLEPQWRREITARYDMGHSTDSAALMLLAALSTVSGGGELTLLMPDSFFNIGSFEGVRRRVLGLRITHLRDYGKPFKGLMTRAQSLSLRKSPATPRQVAKCQYEGREHSRTLRSFANNPKCIINMWLSREGAAAVEAIFAKEHVTLGDDNATWGMGIVTGNNPQYCHSKPHKGDVEVVRGYNITREGITTPDTYIAQDLTPYQQVAPEAFYRAREKVIYKFISTHPVFCNDREQHYILNSANGFIPSEGFALSCDEVVERLNSEVIVWLFEALFRTHKILRHDIERLPLHTAVGRQGSFNEEEYQQYLGIEKDNKGGFQVTKTQ